MPQPTWTLALSLSDPPFHVTTAVFVRPLLGDGVPFEHVHRSLYVVVHASFVEVAGVDRLVDVAVVDDRRGRAASVAAAHWIVAVASAELPQPTTRSRCCSAPRSPA